MNLTNEQLAQLTERATGVAADPENPPTQMELFTSILDRLDALEAAQEG